MATGILIPCGFDHCPVGHDSPVVLACTVGVLTEVLVVLLLVRFINKTRRWFPEPADNQ